ncbi:paeninodin family lasso peptide [Paenibacillus solisilvae]|uniref:Paeninodin family lasso peptide n=1 Tax=Paenibacillus solisilvae TaxID=2486751 RepID=A0ABW0WAK5_9BACL
MTKQTKVWEQPVLEVLEVEMTMGGPNGRIPDKNGKGNHKNAPESS